MPPISALMRVARFLLLAGFAAACRAEGPQTTHWMEQGGRVFQHVVAPDLESGYALAQDRQGFIWVGTQTGLVRWDGYRSRDYVPDPVVPGSLPDSYVHALLADHAGALWIGTHSGGLARYDAPSDSFVPIRDPDGIVGRDVTALADRQSGGLWIVSNRGLAFLDAASAPPSPVPLPENIGRLRSVVAARNGTIWLGSDRGLWARPPGQARFAPVTIDRPDGAPEIIVMRLFEDHEGRIWVGTQLHGTFIVDPGASTARPLQNAGDADLSSDTVYAFVDAGNGEVWIGTYGAGVVRVDVRSGRQHRERHDPATPSSLLDEDVGAMMSSRDGTVWVATAFGLSTYAPRFDAVSTIFGGRGRVLHDANVPAVLMTRKGSIFLANGAQGLEIRDPAGGAPRLLLPDPKQPDTTLPRARVVALAGAPDGTIWIGTQGGLYRTDENGEGVRRVSIPGRPVAEDVWSLLVDGTTLWLGGSDGLWALDTSSAERVTSLQHFDRELGQAQVRVLTSGTAGELWVGANARVFRLDRARGGLQEVHSDPKDPGALTGALVTGLLVDKTGRLWVSTLGQGLQVQVARRPDGLPTFRRITVRDGLPNNGIDALLRGEDGAIWASTDDGVARIDPSSMSIRTIRSAQGAGVTAFWTGAATMAPNGLALFGGEGGLVAIRTSRLHVDQAPLPAPMVTVANVGGRSMTAAQLAVSNEVVVPANSPRLQVEFASLAYADQDGLRYAYRLKGFDGDWNTADPRSRLANYTRLPHGHYELQLRVARPTGEWVSAPDIALRVEPRWFERTEVRAMGLIAALSLAWCFHLWRLRLGAQRQARLEQQVRQRTRELEQSRVQIRQLSSHNAKLLEQERTRVSRELHDEMAQQLAALRMEVMLMRKGPNASTGAEGSTIQGLVERVDNIIRSVRDLVTRLRPPALDGGLPAAIEWLAARFEQQTGIQCDLTLSDCAAFAKPEAATMAFRVVQESLTNVQRHSNATAVRIQLLNDGSSCRLEVHDNGIGFDSTQPRVGYGLLGMEERVVALGGKFEIVSGGAQGGTTVRVIID